MPLAISGYLQRPIYIFDPRLPDTPLRIDSPVQNDNYDSNDSNPICVAFDGNSHYNATVPKGTR